MERRIFEEALRMACLSEETDDKGNLVIGDVKYHQVSSANDYQKGAVNIKVGVEVCTELEAASLNGFQVYLVHDALMLSGIFKKQVEQDMKEQNVPDWRKVAKWMTWTHGPLEESFFQKYQDWKDFMESSPDDISAFMEQDYELPL